MRRSLVGNVQVLGQCGYRDVGARSEAPPGSGSLEALPAWLRAFPLALRARAVRGASLLRTLEPDSIRGLLAGLGARGLVPAGGPVEIPNVWARKASVPAGSHRLNDGLIDALVRAHAEILEARLRFDRVSAPEEAAARPAWMRALRPETVELMDRNGAPLTDVVQVLAYLTWLTRGPLATCPASPDAILDPRSWRAMFHAGLTPCHPLTSTANSNVSSYGAVEIVTAGGYAVPIWALTETQMAVDLIVENAPLLNDFVYRFPTPWGEAVDVVGTQVAATFLGAGLRGNRIRSLTRGNTGAASDSDVPQGKYWPPGAVLGVNFEDSYDARSWTSGREILKRGEPVDCDNPALRTIIKTLLHEASHRAFTVMNRNSGGCQCAGRSFWVDAPGSLAGGRLNRHFYCDWLACNFVDRVWRTSANGSTMRELCAWQCSGASEYGGANPFPEAGATPTPDNCTAV